MTLLTKSNHGMSSRVATSKAHAETGAHLPSLEEQVFQSATSFLARSSGQIGDEDDHEKGDYDEPTDERATEDAKKSSSHHRSSSHRKSSSSKERRTSSSRPSQRHHHEKTRDRDRDRDGHRKSDTRNSDTRNRERERKPSSSSRHHHHKHHNHQGRLKEGKSGLGAAITGDRRRRSSAMLAAAAAVEEALEGDKGTAALRRSPARKNRVMEKMDEDKPTERDIDDWSKPTTLIIPNVSKDKSHHPSKTSNHHRHQQFLPSQRVHRRRNSFTEGSVAPSMTTSREHDKVVAYFEAEIHKLLKTYDKLESKVRRVQRERDSARRESNEANERCSEIQANLDASQAKNEGLLQRIECLEDQLKPLQEFKDKHEKRTGGQRGKPQAEDGHQPVRPGPFARIRERSFSNRNNRNAWDHSAPKSSPDQLQQALSSSFGKLQEDEEDPTEAPPSHANQCTLSNILTEVQAITASGDEYKSESDDQPNSSYPHSNENDLIQNGMGQFEGNVRDLAIGMELAVVTSELETGKARRSPMATPSSAFAAPPPESISKRRNSHMSNHASTSKEATVATTSSSSPSPSVTSNMHATMVDRLRNGVRNRREALDSMMMSKSKQQLLNRAEENDEPNVMAGSTRPAKTEERVSFLMRTKNLRHSNHGGGGGGGRIRNSRFARLAGVGALQQEDNLAVNNTMERHKSFRFRRTAQHNQLPPPAA